LSIFKTGANPKLYILCDAYYDRNKIDIPCNLNRGVPSAVPSVSSIPTSSSAPTFIPDCSCGAGEFKFELELKTDNYPWETSWRIQNENGDVLVTDENVYKERLQIFNHEYCLPVGCYDFVIDDSAWDGICCGFGEGYYDGSIYGWKEVFDGGEFEFNATESFCGEDVCPFATHYPSTSPSVSLTPTLSSAPTPIIDCSCGVGEFKFELELKTDFSPGDISWRIEDGNGEILYSETGYDYYGEQLTIFNYEYCLPVGCYVFVIDDSSGDGICCMSNLFDDGYFNNGNFDDGFFDSYGVEGVDGFDGYYKASIYGWKSFDGGEFGFQAIEEFCGEDVCPFATHYPSTTPSMLSSLVPSTSPSVSSIPTSSSAPSLHRDCSCGVGEFKFELELKTDFSPGDISWRIEDGNGEILYSETGYDYYGEQLTIFNYEYCLPVGCYVFVIDDSSGDGICCMSNLFDDGYFNNGNFDDGFFDSYGVEGVDGFDGYYKASIYGWKSFDGGDFGSQAIEQFCGEDVCPFATHYPSTSPSASSLPSISPSSAVSLIPSVSLTPTLSSAPTPISGCSCGVGEFKFELELKTDFSPRDISWRIEDGNGEILYSETQYNEELETFNHEYCLPVGCYVFVIDDSSGDGICCISDYFDDGYFNNGYFDDGFFYYYGVEGVDGFDGYYKASIYGWKEVFDGGEFEYNAIEEFCGEDVCPFATHYPSTSPSTSSLPSISPQPSTIDDDLYYDDFYYDDFYYDDFYYDDFYYDDFYYDDFYYSIPISIPKTPFKFDTSSKTWGECKIAAVKNGYTFASIRNEGENDAVADYLQSNGIGDVWLGGYQNSYEDEPAGYWGWLDGTPWADTTYTNWAPGEPNNWNNNENHLSLRSWDGTWRDYSIERRMLCLFRDPS